MSRTAPSGQPMRLPASARIVRVTDDAVVEALQAGAWVQTPRTWKQEGDAITIMGDLLIRGAPRAVVVKRLPERRGVKRWLHRALRLSPAMRQWRGAEIVASTGLLTATPLALARGGGFEWLALDAVRGEDALRRIDRMRRESAPVRHEHELAHLLGALVALFTNAGVRNRDHKLSNLIVTDEGDLAVIDTVGVTRGGGGARRMLLAMLLELSGVGLMPRRTLLLRALLASGAAPRSMWRTLARDLARAGDTRPHIDPLRSPDV